MRILGIIPARGGSKRVPRKNLRQLGGTPLVVRAIDLALRCPSLTSIAVTSDDPEVIQLAAMHPPVVPLDRPGEISGDTAPAIDYVQHALKVLEVSRGAARFDAVCILQPSSPLTLPEDVEGTIALFKEGHAPAAVSIVKVDHATHPFKLKRLVAGKLFPFVEAELGRTSAHELPELYVRNCAVYLTRRDLVDAGKIISDDSVGYLMPRERSVDINDELDFSFAEFLLSRGSQGTGDR